MKVLESTFVPK